MSINFYNIKSRERRVAETEPMISALLNSSDMGINSKGGQDFFWRLAPEVEIQFKRFKQDPQILDIISSRMKKAVEEISDTDVLKYISDITDSESAPIAQDADFQEEYVQMVREMERRERASIKKAEAKFKKENPEPEEEDEDAGVDPDPDPA